MDSTTSWEKLFLSTLPEIVSPGETAELEKFLQKAISSANREWPEFTLEPSLFVSYLASMCNEKQTAMRALKEMATDDLYAACACARGDEKAVKAVEDRYFKGVEWVCKKMRLDTSTADDVKQSLREFLFATRQANGLTMISTYKGRGPLPAWIGVIVSRMAGRTLDIKNRELPFKSGLFDYLQAENQDEELARLKGTYSVEFKKVFKKALKELSEEDRTLLRHRYIERISIDDIGKKYEIHRATAARRVVKAQNALMEQTKELLMLELDVNTESYESIMRLIQSKVEVTLNGILEE